MEGIINLEWMFYALGTFCFLRGSYLLFIKPFKKKKQKEEDEEDDDIPNMGAMC